MIHGLGTSRRFPLMFITSKQLHRLDVSNFSVLIKLLNGYHITQGHQED